MKLKERAVLLARCQNCFIPRDFCITTTLSLDAFAATTPRFSTVHVDEAARSRSQNGRFVDVFLDGELICKET